MSDKTILVGIFDESVISYAVVHEFGDRGRDFLRVAYDTNISNILDFVEKEYMQVLDKKITVDMARKNIGQYVVNLIKEVIIAKGLVKTGKMLNSVEYKIG
jgi:hypothetical protein